MARAQGARAQMALAFESVYGTPPGSGFTQMPFITSSLAAEQPLLASELLGYGRDPRAPLLDAITTDGDVEVPIDAVGFGFWLKAAFGAPTTAGTVASTGAITFSAQPAVNATLTINGTAFTFVASGATGNQVNIGANLAATMTALAVALNASVVTAVALATYTGTATALTMVFDVLGSTGNTFTLAASISPLSNGTVSAATLTGGLNSHTFMSGSWTLPSMSIEVGMPEVPRFAMYSGCVLDSLSWSMERSGLLSSKVMLVAQSETIAGATAAGTPAAIALKRFGHFNGAIKRDGVALGNIVSADVTYANNLDRIETIRSDAKIDGADPKRVSVRLAAVGGKQVRAELEGVGDAGVKGFGRMSKEAEIANARLAAFSTRVKIAAAVAVAAAAAAGIAMIRSGLETIDAQANLAQSLGTTTRSIQVLTFAGDLAGVSMDEITAATKKLTLKLSDAAGGTGTAVTALQRLHLTATDLQALPLDERIVAIQDALAKFVPPAERAAVASALFGDKAALAFSRIDSATLRQASQDITDFGVAVSDQDADQIRTAGDAIDRLGLVWLGLTNQLTVAVAPALETVANALADATRAGGIFQTSISFLGEHIGEIASIAGAFATFFAGRFIIALGAAALGVSGFSLSLTVLKGALIRTGIGALIVGAGELVYQFSKLVEGAGGFGAALGLLSDLASEVWDRIGLGVDAVVASLSASWSGITATVADAMQGALVAVVGFGNSSAGVFQGAFDAMKAIWSALPSAIGDFAFQAANGLIGGVEAMLNGVVTRINTFISGLNAALDMLPDWATGEGGIQIGTLDPVTLGRVGNPFEGAATAAGAAAADAFKAAMGKTYLETPDLGLGTMASDARDSAAAYNEAAGMLADAATRPLSSWQALQDAMTKAGTDGAAALDSATTAADGTTDALNGAGTAAGGAGAAGKAAADAAATGWAAVTAALADYAAKARDIGADVGQTLVGAFQSAEDAVANFVKTGKLSFGDLVTSILADLAKLAARKFILGPIASALDGVLGNLGGGGLFGNVVNAAVHHAGGIVGGSAPLRAVPMLAFAGAPRMHSGGFAGLRPDEVPAILQKGERVLSRRETAGYGAGTHYNRPAGVESGSPTAWAPQSKPFWFTELGCPAVDRGTNQPNVFYDPKSSESSTP